MFGVRVSLAILGTAVALGSMATEAEARHCRQSHRQHHQRHECHQRHHGHHDQCNPGHSQNYHRTSHAGHHQGHHGSVGNCCESGGWQEMGNDQYPVMGHQSGLACCSVPAVMSPQRVVAPVIVTPPPPAVIQNAPPTPGI